MGKPKTLSRKAKKLAQKKGKLTLSMTNCIMCDKKKSSLSELNIKGTQADLSKFSVEEILDKADSYIEEYNYDMAQKFLHRALEINCDHPRALETIASLLLEAGETEKAKQCLGRAITVMPGQGHAKYFSLAQLFAGQESLDLYKQGILVLQETISQLNPSESEAKEAQKELSSAFSAVAELYMTDLCDNDEAEAECLRCVQKSVEIDQNNPEAWQTKARLHLVKSEFEQARKDLNRSLDLWLPTYMAVLENRPQEAAGKFDPVEVCPLLYTTRLSTARMLIELEEWDKAVNVLDGLLEEDEDIVDAWYLMGWSNKVRAELEKDDMYLGNARYFLSRAKEVNVKNPTEDKEMVYRK